MSQVIKLNALVHPYNGIEVYLFGHEDLSCVCFIKDDVVTMDELFLHDIFHHKILDVGFDYRSEYLTTFLDKDYPFVYEPWELKNEKEIRKQYIKHIENLPDRNEIRRFVYRAKKILGEIDIRDFMYKLKIEIDKISYNGIFDLVLDLKNIKVNLYASTDIST